MNNFLIVKVLKDIVSLGELKISFALVFVKKSSNDIITGNFDREKLMKTRIFTIKIFIYLTSLTRAGSPQQFMPITVGPALPNPPCQLSLWEETGVLCFNFKIYITQTCMSDHSYCSLPAFLLLGPDSCLGHYISPLLNKSLLYYATSQNFL